MSEEEIKKVECELCGSTGCSVTLYCNETGEGGTYLCGDCYEDECS